MYRIINSDFVDFEGGNAVIRVDIVVDKESDIPTPETNWSAGSMALITETKEFKVLTNGGEWK
jgi:hypothetical protein